MSKQLSRAAQLELERFVFFCLHDCVETFNKTPDTDWLGPYLVMLWGLCYVHSSTEHQSRSPLRSWRVCEVGVKSSALGGCKTTCKRGSRSFEMTQHIPRDKMFSETKDLLLTNQNFQNRITSTANFQIKTEF